MPDPITPEEIARLREMQTQRLMDRDYLMGTEQHDNYTDRARVRDRIFKTGGDLLDALPRLLDEIERQAKEIERLRAALERISKWFGEFPDTGKKWSNGDPVSYGAEYGSNGERDYMRAIAKRALRGEP